MKKEVIPAVLGGDLASGKMRVAALLPPPATSVYPSAAVQHENPISHRNVMCLRDCRPVIQTRLTHFAG